MTLKAPFLSLLGRVKVARIGSYSLFVGGLAAVLYACWCVAHPLAWAVGGVMGSVLGYLANLERDPYHFRDKHWDR